MLVWKAMPSMVATMRTCRERLLMSPMVATTSCISSPPRLATRVAEAAGWSA